MTAPASIAPDGGASDARRQPRGLPTLPGRLDEATQPATDMPPNIAAQWRLIDRALATEQASDAARGAVQRLHDYVHGMPGPRQAQNLPTVFMQVTEQFAAQLGHPNAIRLDDGTALIFSFYSEDPWLAAYAHDPVAVHGRGLAAEGSSR